VTEEIDQERCTFLQFLKLQKLCHLDLGSGQGHISMHNAHRTTSVPDHVTVGSSSTKIWLFEVRVISTFREVWSHVIDLMIYKKEIQKSDCRLGTILSQSTISFEFHVKMAEEIDLEKCNFRNFRSSVTLTLTLDHVVSHIGVHIQLRSTYKPTYIEIRKTFWGRVDGSMYIPTYGWLDTPRVPIY